MSLMHIMSVDFARVADGRPGITCNRAVCCARSYVKHGFTLAFYRLKGCLLNLIVYLFCPSFYLFWCVSSKKKSDEVV